MELTYVTTNKNKIKVAQKYLERNNITLTGYHLEMEEIQSHSGEEIITKKAVQAFAKIQKPLIVSDHFWNIEALRGFPGAYMKYINEWLTPQDILNLMKPHTNRTIYLEEYLYYIDEKQQKLFYKPTKGVILQEIKGPVEEASRSVISLRKDQISIAECWRKGIDPVDKYDVWEELAAWIKSIV